MARVIIVDDHAVVRMGLRQILAEEPDIVKVGEAADASQLTRLLEAEAWDLVVLDLSMPGKGGLEVLRELKERYPRLPVLVLSIHPEEQYALRVIKAGAAGYVNKQSAPEELVTAVRGVLAGGRYLSAAAAGQLAGLLGPDAEARSHAALSDREFQVLARIAAGRATKEIAAELCLSPKTVSTYRARVLSKLGLATTAELIRYAVDNGIAG
jgi:two-component system invasion response regulator UvrY